jgi:hypothetical protein
MPRIPRFVTCAVIAVAVVWFCGWLIKREQPALAKYRIKRLLSRIEPWTASTNYSASGWRQLVTTAKAIQRADPKLASEALSQHQRRFAAQAGSLAVEQAKLFLLLQVVFDLPENAPDQQRVPFGDWMRGRSDLNPDGTINLAWPLAWNRGNPVLVAGCEGAAGSNYSVADEYAYLRYHFRYRDLSSFQTGGAGSR